MKVLSVQIENILSIETASLEFSESGLILVEGWNHDAGRANGAGKTAIFDALAFALFDKVPRKITASEILRRGTKSGSATARVELGSGSILTVTRTRPKGSKYYLDGVEQNWTQTEFEAKIKLTYTQFIASMYCAQSKSETRFLHLNDSEKKNFMLQLLSLDEFASCKKVADQKVKDITVLVDDDKRKLTGFSSKIDAYSESLVDVELYQNMVGVIDGEIQSLTRSIIQLQKVQEPDFTKFTKLEDDVRAKQSEFATARATRTLLHDQYRRLSSKVKPFDGESACSACGTEFDTSDAEAHHGKEMDRITADMLDIKTQIDECDSVLAKENSVTELSRKIREKRQAESLEYNKASKSITEHEGLIKTKTKDRENAISKLEANVDLTNKINTLRQASVKVSKNIDVNVREIEVYKTISSLYAPTGAQAYILDSIVESFNDSVSRYVDLVWPNVSYTLQSYKETSKGDITAKFSECLMMNGKEVSIGSLSGGECKALSLCVDFAVLDILEKYFGFALNPIVLDEPFDGLDFVGREIVVELLEKLGVNRQIFVVDHASEAKSMFSKVITVEKKGGISTVSLDL